MFGSLNTPKITKVSSRLFTIPEKGAKDQVKTGAEMGSPVSDHFLMDNVENSKEMSLFEPDSKDSGFSEDAPEDFDKLVSSPLSLEDNEATILCFLSPEGDKKDYTPLKSLFVGTKKRLFLSPDVKSPSAQAACSLKRLKIFDISRDEGLLNDNEDLTAEFGCLKSEKLFLGSLEAAALVPSIEIKKNIVKDAVEKSEADGDLIGDFSKNYALPLVLGSHPDLKSISVETMRDILDGRYDDILDSFTIVDSRYPYEFEGGHIKGAVNLYMKEDYLNLLDKPSRLSSERHILIFHCEFSKERGPTMVRHLRKEDRNRNATNYPSLSFPELYILEGGYKKFFQSFPEYCNPMTYKQMLHPDHADEMRFFRKKCKSSDDTKTCKKPVKSRTVRKFLSNDF